MSDLFNFMKETVKEQAEAIKIGASLSKDLQDLHNDNIEKHRFEIQDTAFAKWLVTQFPDDAIAHIFECLRDGESDNMAWELMQVVHGEDFKITWDTIAEAIIWLRKHVKLD